MLTYQALPSTYESAKPVLQNMLLGLVASAGSNAGQAKAPAPPRSLIAQGGSLQVLVTWNAPVNPQGVVGYCVYKDNEVNKIATISDPATRQYSFKVTSATPTAFYVSSMNARGFESQKVQVIGQANTDELVVSGTGGGTGGSAPPPPPGYDGEPSGGGNRRKFY